MTINKTVNRTFSSDRPELGQIVLRSILPVFSKIFDEETKQAASMNQLPEPESYCKRLSAKEHMKFGQHIVHRVA